MCHVCELYSIGSCCTPIPGKPASVNDVESVPPCQSHRVVQLVHDESAHPVLQQSGAPERGRIAFTGTDLWLHGSVQTRVPWSEIVSFRRDGTALIVQRRPDGPASRMTLPSLAAAMRAAEVRQRSWPLAIEGLTGIVAGFIALLSPVYDLLPVYLISAWALMTGILEIIAGLQLRRHFGGEWLLMASGFSSIALGMLVVIVPLTTLRFWVGGYALLFGALLMVLGLRLRPVLRQETTGRL